MRITEVIVHKWQMSQLFTNDKLQICICGNDGNCEQLRFVNNEVIGKDSIVEKQEKVELPTERFGESGNALILVGGTTSDRDLAARIMGFQVER